MRGWKAEATRRQDAQPGQAVLQVQEEAQSALHGALINELGLSPCLTL